MGLPLNLTGYGVQSDKLGDTFCIYFLSVHTAVKLYLSDGEVTEDISKALWSDDMNFITQELTNILKDKEFVNYLEGMLVF